jgi:ABC-type sugar transport system substrate-binding protein
MGTRSASGKVVRRAGRAVLAAGRGVGVWWLSVWRTLAGPEGHRVVAKLVVAYVGLYSLLVAHFEYLQGRAADERKEALEALASGECPRQMAALRNLGPVQSMAVPREPALTTMWTWALPPWRAIREGSDRPNRDLLRDRVRDLVEDPAFLRACGAGDDAPYRLSAERADWRGADLHGAILARVDLSGAVMAGADLRGANLQRANLVGADLRGADLQGADLRFANASEADFRGADLREAAATGAMLRRADLRQVAWADRDATGRFARRADLRWADLRWARTDEGLPDADDGGLAVREVGARSPGGRLPWRIGVSYQNLSYPFVKALKKAVDAEAAARNVQVVEADAQNDVGSERNNVRSLLPHVDCLALQAVDRDGSVEAVEEANRAGVPVVQFNMMAHGGRYVAFAGPEHAESGELMCQWLKAFVEGSGIERPLVLYLRGKPNQDSDFARDLALRACLKREGLETRMDLLERVAGYEWKKAGDRWRAVVESGLHPDAVVANNDDMALGVLDALMMPAVRAFLVNGALEQRSSRDLLPDLGNCPLAEMAFLGRSVGDEGDRIRFKDLTACPRSLEALRRAVPLPTVRVVGIDGTPDAMVAIGLRWMSTTVFQNPAAQGTAAVDACLAWLESGPEQREAAVRDTVRPAAFQFLAVDVENYASLLRSTLDAYPPSATAPDAPSGPDAL